MPAAPLGPHSEAVRSADTRSGAKGADKYTLLAELGRGGMANVYLAVARGPSGFNKLVVLKCLRSDLSDDAELIALFLEEARVSARLNHPHVVQAYEVGEHAGRPVIVMEYLEGQTLASLVERATPGGRLPLSLHLRILVDALEGLHHAHELTDYAGKRLDLVHRDVSPQNIFVTFDGQVKVLDFGIAKIVNSRSQTSTGVLKGKVHYMAPEQMLCLPVDRRADLYAAGVMAWQAATGQRMWKDVTDLQVMTLVTNEGAPLPRTVNPAVSPALEAIIMKALARNPDDRYATALEFAAELESFMEDTGTGVSNRGLATLMRELFEDVRNETRAIVEAQLLEVGNGNDDSRPMIPPNLVRISTWPEERPLRTGTNAVATSTPAKASSRPRWLAAACGDRLCPGVGMPCSRHVDPRDEKLGRVEPRPALRAVRGAFGRASRGAGAVCGRAGAFGHAHALGHAEARHDDLGRNGIADQPVQGRRTVSTRSSTRSAPNWPGTRPRRSWLRPAATRTWSWSSRGSCSRRRRGACRRPPRRRRNLRSAPATRRRAEAGAVRPLHRCQRNKEIPTRVPLTGAAPARWRSGAHREAAARTASHGLLMTQNGA